jgi:hypothetical protein
VSARKLTVEQHAEMRTLYSAGYGATRLALMFGIKREGVYYVVSPRRRQGQLDARLRQVARNRLAAARPADHGRLLELRALPKMSPDQEHEWFELGSRVFGGRAFSRVPQGDQCDRVVAEALPIPVES